MKVERVPLQHPTAQGDTEVLIGKHVLQDPRPGETSRIYTFATIGFLFSDGGDDWCAGPPYWVKCQQGGKRPCRRCEQVGIFPDEDQG